jgi:hypothetical protein
VHDASAAVCVRIDTHGVKLIAHSGKATPMHADLILVMHMPFWFKLQHRLYDWFLA